eukprot:m.183576 g.183576  ORF g.183576 m.183576 type:complete len:120 (+) comp14693_c1_seq2:2188-2547(+)
MWRWAFVEDQDWSADFGGEQQRQTRLNDFKNEVVQCEDAVPFEEVLDRACRAAGLAREPALHAENTFFVRLDHHWRLSFTCDGTVMVGHVFRSEFQQGSRLPSEVANRAQNGRYKIQDL